MSSDVDASAAGTRVTTAGGGRGQAAVLGRDWRLVVGVPGSGWFWPAPHGRPDAGLDEGGER
jgi:hypothetical protein